MATFVKYEDFAEELAKGTHNFNAHTFKAALTNTAPNVATHVGLADIGELSPGGGYSAGGVTVPVSLSRTGGTAKVTATDAEITASGGSIGPFRYVVLYNDTATGDPLVGYYDRGGSITLADGDKLVIDFEPGTGWLTVS